MIRDSKILLLFLFLFLSCQRSSSTKVTFSKNYRSTGKGEYLKSMKNGIWKYNVENEDCKIEWKRAYADSNLLEFIIPASFVLKKIPNAILFAEDSISNYRFSISRADLGQVNSLRRYITLVKNKLKQKGNDSSLGNTYYLHGQDSLSFGFTSMRHGEKQFGYFVLYKKTKNHVVDYTFRYPLDESAHWIQVLFWEIIFSINGPRDLELVEDDIRNIE